MLELLKADFPQLPLLIPSLLLLLHLCACTTESPETAANPEPDQVEEIPEDIALLPNAKGSGNVRSLHETMALDSTGNLKALVEQFTAETTAAARNALLPQIVFLWAGGQASNVSYRVESNKDIISPEQLGVLEAFWGGFNFTRINGINHANQLAG